MLYSLQEWLLHNNGNLGLNLHVKIVLDLLSLLTERFIDSESIFGQRCVILNSDPNKWQLLVLVEITSLDKFVHS